MLAPFNRGLPGDSIGKAVKITKLEPGSSLIPAKV
jgi:hypothetical protein